MPALSEQPLDPGINTSADLEEIVAPSKNEQWKITKFETTPPMSTYLVAFANGHFEHLETSVVMPLSKKTVPLRIYGAFIIFIVCSCSDTVGNSYCRYHPSGSVRT